MTCSCTEAFGRRFLAHQLTTARELATQIDAPVTLGFVSNICAECRGLPAEPCPKAEGFGMTSKVKRYYWREIFFLETWRKAEWSEAHSDATSEDRENAYAAIDTEVLNEIKAQHQSSPKYVFSEASQEDVLKRYSVTVEAIKATYADSPKKGAVVILGDEIVSVEAYVTHLYQSQGWSVMPLESLPLHALFGVMMWMVIQDGADPRVDHEGVGDSTVFEATGQKIPGWTLMPDDFGSDGYAIRRKEAIEDHFSTFPDNREDLLWLFDYWCPLSADLRNYLWAHREDTVERARRLIEILSPTQLVSILRYLIADYWGHYLGWPDLLLYRGDEILLIEVKSSGDKLSQEQKRWIADNHAQLKPPFRVVKLHRKNG